MALHSESSLMLFRNMISQACRRMVILERAVTACIE